MAGTTRILEGIQGSLAQLTGAGGLANLVNFVSQLGRSTDKLSMNSVRLGSNLTSVTKQLGPELGKLAGRNTELANALDLMDEGLSINNKELTKLTLETKANHGNSKSLQKLMRQSVVTGNVSNNTMGDFAHRISKLRDTYQISTDNLVEAFQKTAQDLDLAFYGVGKEFTLAIGELEGKFGRGASDLFQKFSSQILNPEFFGKSMQFGLKDQIDRMTRAGATGEQIQTAMLDAVKILKPKIDQFRQSMQGLPEPVILDRLANYFGNKDIVVLAEAISKLEPKEVVAGGTPEDKFANLNTAIDKATNRLQEIAQNVVPFLVEHMELLITAMEVLGTKIILNKLTLGLTRVGVTFSRMGGLLGSVGRIMPFITRLLGPIGMALTILMMVWPYIKKFLNIGGDDEEETRAEKERASAEERKRLEEQRNKAIADAKRAVDYRTNSYLQMQSKTLNDTMQSLIYGSDLAAKTVDLNEKQLNALNMLLGVVSNNVKRGQSPVPAGVK